MSVGRVLTLGLGSFAGVQYLPTLGLGPDAPPVVTDYQSTPGYLRHSYELWRHSVRLRSEALQSRDAEVIKPVIAAFTESDYRRRAEIIGKLLAGLRSDIDTYQSDLAAMESRRAFAIQQQIEREILAKQQQIQFAMLQRQILMEEMEVLDIAYLAVVATVFTLQ